MPSSPAPRAAVVLSLLAGCALVATFACRRPADAGYWKDRRQRPRPFPGLEIEAVWDKEVAFCPDTIRAGAWGGPRIGDGTRWLQLDPEDGTATPAGAPTEQLAADGETERLEAILDAEFPELAPRSRIVLWERKAFFVLPDRGTLHAMDVRKGRQRWHVRAGGSVVVPPQVYRGRLVLLSLDNYVYCLRANNGHEMWRSRTAARLTRPAAFWKDRVLVAPEGSPTIEALDMYDGSRAGSWTLPGDDEHFVTMPLVLGDLLFAAHAPYGTGKCSIVALRLAARPS